MSRAALLAALLTLSGCATTSESYGPDEQGYTWRQLLPAIPTERWFVELVPDGQVFLRCALEPKAQACSIRRPNSDGLLECYVYLPANTRTWMMAHEFKHCLGWVHGTKEEAR